jgi:predicted transcriptional regulator
MRKPRFDRAELARMLLEGKSQKEIAQVFGVSKMAISKAAKKLVPAVVRQVDTREPGVSSEQGAQAAADKIQEEFGDPEEMMANYEKLVSVEAGKLNKHRDYFMAKGVNPFREALKNILQFHDQFDTITGLKAK